MFECSTRADTLKLILKNNFRYFLEFYRILYIGGQINPKNVVTVQCVQKSGNERSQNNSGILNNT
jgi:hypothetical protein